MPVAESPSMTDSHECRTASRHRMHRQPQRTHHFMRRDMPSIHLACFTQMVYRSGSLWIVNADQLTHPHRQQPARLVKIITAIFLVTQAPGLLIIDDQIIYIRKQRFNPALVTRGFRRGNQVQRDQKPWCCRFASARTPLVCHSLSSCSSAGSSSMYATWAMRA